MIEPVICVSCARQITHADIIMFVKEKANVDTEADFSKFFDSRGIKRYCCRKVFTTMVIMDKKIS